MNYESRFTNINNMKTNNHKSSIINHKSGFTVIEMIIVVGLIAALLGAASLRLLNISQIASVMNSTDKLVTDIKEQQTKAMATDTSGSGVVSDYGVYFQTGSYTLFRGSSYSVSDPGNLVVSLGTNIQSTATFPGSTLVLTKGSGEVAGFSAGQNTVTIRNTINNEQQTVTVNRYGVIISVD
jgi:prepilin-type N-terminal cleavage/methylation domain-containing protein